MNPVPASVGAPRTPLVNLFPAEITQQRSQSRAKRLLGMVLLLFVAFLIAVWVLTWSMRQSAESALADVNAETPVKQAELATYDYLPLLEAQVTNSRNARTWAGVADVAWADQLTSLLSAIPASVRIETLAVAPATPVAPVLIGDSLFATADMGAITFSGQSLHEVDTSDLQEAINALPGFKDAVIDAVGIPDGDTIAYWEYTGSARISMNAFSGRTATTQEIIAVQPTEEASEQPTDDAATEGEG